MILVVNPANATKEMEEAAINRDNIKTWIADRNNLQENLAPIDNSQPLLPLWRFERQESPLEQRNRIFEPILTTEDIQDMTREFQGLISRFESTLLTADAQESNIELSTSQVIEQSISQRAQGNKKSPQKLSKLINHNSHQVLQKAKTELVSFLGLVKQGRYTQAQTKWLETKRSLWDSYPIDRPVASSEVRAIWFDRGTIVKARSEADLIPTFDRMAKAGINTVFFETINSGYPIYPSRVAPQQNPLARGWDPLKAAVKLAKERDMELHAWVWTFAVVNQRHNEILNLPKEYPGPVLSRYPDWGTTDQEGNSFHHSSGKAFLDPANPGVRRYLSLLLEEIATNYDVDGIHLDYIRYPFQNSTGEYNYGYGKSSRYKFKQMTGIDPIELHVGGELWSQWTGFRLTQIDDFVAAVSQRLKAKHPDLILSTAVFPMPRQERLNTIQQHWEKWVREGSIDLLVPMTYAEDTEGLYQLTRPLFDSFIEEKALLLPGIRLLNIPDIVAVDQMQLLRGMSTEGFALFAAENLNLNLEKILSRTHNSLAPTTKPLPYRQPFLATASRYQSLQKEWNFFITSNQGEINDDDLKEWGKRADELARNLEKLAQKPSQKNLSLAQMSLSSFRRGFPRWIDDNQAVSDYQIDVWNNRLKTLERLLNYGEKRQFSQL
ncbi:glycoside hydrolase family 10 protein [Xenococcus sp. PCC 7305]|uniref:glycoside hydrolase family 10 protein n=1 Tax=Xenococcus sp. PCC 7305 TaxID=102125 RepID=UPI0002FA3BDC|nr:family 10 glycosylhydrolase [Xenococcus sp. PCC 7305]